MSNVSGFKTAMTTIRKSSSLKKLIANLLLGGGFLGTVIVLQIFEPELSRHTNNPKLFFFLFTPMVIGFIGNSLIQLFFIKCSACGENIAPTVMRSGSPFAISKKINFCPCCGVSLDINS
jgi:hypothetical protein